MIDRECPEPGVGIPRRVEDLVQQHPAQACGKAEGEEEREPDRRCHIPDQER